MCTNMVQHLAWLQFWLRWFLFAPASDACCTTCMFCCFHLCSFLLCAALCSLFLWIALSSCLWLPAWQRRERLLCYYNLRDRVDCHRMNASGQVLLLFCSFLPGSKGPQGNCETGFPFEHMDSSLYWRGRWDLAWKHEDLWQHLHSIASFCCWLFLWRQRCLSLTGRCYYFLGC